MLWPCKKSMLDFMAFVNMLLVLIFYTLIADKPPNQTYAEYNSGLLNQQRLVEISFDLPYTCNECLLTI